jgi:plasmid maintenance system antidote protein VapI
MLVQSVISRKIRPVHPGTIIVDELENRGINIKDYCGENPQLLEILEGSRPIDSLFASNIENQLGISISRLLVAQRKVDIWNSNYETN